jgi:hypothetical protein
MNKKFGFKEQLCKGRAKEKLFAEGYLVNQEELVESGVRDFDFYTKDSKQKVELKSDTYVSENFFVEYYGVWEKETLGSFWQSRDKGVDIFIYWFPNMDEVYTFRNLAETCAYLEQYIESMNLQPILIPNHGYHGLGYKIPKVALAHLYTKE